MAELQKAIYQDDNAAREHLERMRWPDGPVCPHCGSVDNATKLNGKSTRPGVHKCRGCRKPFSVTIGTLFERSHIPLSKWLLAFHLMCASKKGMSAHQLHRMVGVTYKTAWFMEHRIREAMKDGNPGPMGGDGESLQADETYIGRKKDKPKTRTSGEPFKHAPRGVATKHAVISLVSKGKARTFHVDNANTASVRKILLENVKKETALHTDESRLYTKVGKEYADHKTVKHSVGEYVRDGAHVNNAENYFSIFKRGMKGVYQHCSEKHLQRYLNEFDFRYNNRDITDGERADAALKGIEGKRLTYQRSKAA
jgi:transposase-like protein